MFILFNHVSFSLKRCLQVSQFCSFSNVVRIYYCALFSCVMPPYVLINKEIPKVTYYYVLILNLNLKCIINFLKVISISKEYFI